MYYLYAITNIKTGKIYIGRTHDIKIRWNQHKRGNTQFIDKMMKEEGTNSFQIEWIVSAKNKYFANKMESILIEQYNSEDGNFGYNKTQGGGASGASAASIGGQVPAVVGLLKSTRDRGLMSPWSR